ncbi:FUN14 domain-containing protein 1A-like [Harmonia axyridis]|uniref:FUN14 domain-containing protein 1A-like n=1 Tax=Harmonia axyridis TaxID=115357 RepID=UPI001E275E22|nr:FUN14 domain-containing protein 1A-like [Harmonia axyridis]
MASKTVEDAILQRTNHNHPNIFEKIFCEIRDTTSSNQMLIGMSLGWVSGFFALKIGRTTMMAIGGGMILLEMANANKLIKINWDRVNENFEDVKYEIKKQKESTWINEAVYFAEKYTSFSSGFLGGFLIGLGSH